MLIEIQLFWSVVELGLEWFGVDLCGEKNDDLSFRVHGEEYLDFLISCSLLRFFLCGQSAMISFY